MDVDTVRMSWRAKGLYHSILNGSFIIREVMSKIDSYGNHVSWPLERAHDYDFGPRTTFTDVIPGTESFMFHSRVIASNIIIIANYNPDEKLPISQLKVIKYAIQQYEDEPDKPGREKIEELTKRYNQLQVYVHRLDAILVNESHFSYIPRDITNIIRSYLLLE